MTEVFHYLVTDLSGEPLASTLENEVFPQIKIFRRNVRGIRHELSELGTRNGHTRYLWEIHVDLFGGTTAPPAISELQAALGALAKVSGPLETVVCATIVADLDENRGHVDFAPSLVKVPVGKPLVWCFLGLPPGFTPWIDFLGFRPAGAQRGELRSSFEPAFEELTLGASIVTGQATGPAGTYWYTVSLIPGRRTQEILRLECGDLSWHEDQPGAGIELDNPPVRGS